MNKVEKKMAMYEFYNKKTEEFELGYNENVAKIVTTVSLNGGATRIVGINLSDRYSWVETTNKDNHTLDYENSNGSSYTQKFDENNNITLYTRTTPKGNGVVEVYVYDHVNGKSWTTTHDKNNNQLSYKNTNGSQFWTKEYDNANNLTTHTLTTKHGNGKSVVVIEQYDKGELNKTETITYDKDGNVLACNGVINLTLSKVKEACPKCTKDRDIDYVKMQIDVLTQQLAELTNEEIK